MVLSHHSTHITVTNLTSSPDVDQAGIYGVDGSTWAASAGMPLSATELNAIIKGFTDSSALVSSGVYIGGEKNLFLRGDADSMIAKSKQGGLVASKTSQAIVIGVQKLKDDKDGRKIETAVGVVSKMADYLRDSGY